MSTVKVQTAQKIWRSQPPIDYVDTSLVINTWETVVADLSEGEPARLWYIIVEQTNNGAAIETIEFEITINGTPYLVTHAGIASGVRDFVFSQLVDAAGDFAFAGAVSIVTVLNPTLDPDNAIPFGAISVGLIRVRQTTAVDGVAAQIEVNVVWDKLEDA